MRFRSHVFASCSLVILLLLPRIAGADEPRPISAGAPTSTGQLVGGLTIGVGGLTAGTGLLVYLLASLKASSAGSGPMFATGGYPSGCSYHYSSDPRGQEACEDRRSSEVRSDKKEAEETRDDATLAMGIGTAVAAVGVVIFLLHLSPNVRATSSRQSTVATLGGVF
jgi:hypothetical protein